MSARAFRYYSQAAAVDAAAERAVDLITELSEKDSSDEIWRDPQAIYDQLDAKRNEIFQAMRELEAAKEADQEKIEFGEQQLKVAYMDMITDAFADVLNNLKESEENIDVDVLVDCLQSGLDLMSQEDKEMLMKDHNGKDEEDTEGPTPHEIRRRELGYGNVQAAT